MLTAADLRGLYAILPTPAKENAGDFQARDTVDLDETERLVKALIRDGARGLIILGTTGECATLSRADADAFATCVLEVAGGRIPSFVGTTALGAHEVADRMKFIRERGAQGTLLGLPMWQPLTTPMAVDFYRSVSQAFPDIAIMVYANARAFRYSFPLEFWQALAKGAPSVVAAKFSRPKNLAELIAATAGRINFVPNEMTVTDFYRAAPETTTACWATSAGMGPAPAVALMNAILAKDEERIRSLTAEIAWANEPVKSLIENPEIFASFNIQIEKTRINASGYCRSGPVRPPYAHIPAEYESAAAECGRRWNTLCRKLEASSAKARATA